jgi:nitrite reductase/ring-hydroxylating ferredoxin subunit
VPEFVAVARIEDIPEGEVRAVEAGGRAIALAHAGGRVYALQGECAHMHGPLGEGHVDGCVLTCPWHGWQYDVRTGENEFDRAITIETFDVQVEDGEIRVAL